MLFRLITICFVSTTWAFSQVGKPVANDSSTQSPVPVFDPSNETVTFLGQTFTLKDTRIGLHFESYLASKSYQGNEAKKYKQDLETIQRLLQQGSGVRNKVSTAYKLLKEAAKYEGDHNVSESLGSAVVSALNSMETIRKRDAYTVKLRRERAHLIKKMDFISTRTDFDTKRSVGGNRNKQQRNQLNKNFKSSEYRNLVRRVLEIELLIKKNQGVGLVQLAQSKTNFQAILVQLFIQRRFEHVVMGCRFYINIYKPSNSKLSIKKGSLMADFFRKSVGVSPTIPGLEGFALEVIAKVKGLVDSSKNHIKRDELHSASNRLLEAYAVGEHLTYIQMLPLELKQKVYEYARTSNHLLDAIEARDFGQARTLNDKLVKMAKDYRHTKIDAYITSFTRASNQHAINAFLHMSKQEKELMFREIENARVLWPTNPKLDEISTLLDNKLHTVKTQHYDYKELKEEFDQYVLNQRYMIILGEENWAKFATQFNINDDISRLDQLREISDKYMPIIKELEKCKILAEEQQHCHAWEACNKLKNKHPDIKEIDEALIDYRRKADKYVRLIKTARRHITIKNYGSALSHYFEARKLYPRSEHANLGIKLLIEIRNR